MADWWPRVYSAYAWSRTAQGTGVLLYCGAYAALGLCLSSFGPVILDLSVQVRRVWERNIVRGRELRST